MALSEWRVAPLEAIDEHGFLVAAARALGVPHRMAWQRVLEMESCLGVRLLKTTSGGLAGGSSNLLAGQDLVRRYHALRTGLDELVLDPFQSAFRDASD